MNQSFNPLSQPGVIKRTLAAVKRVGVRCDVGPDRGIGHVMRCLALAEEVRRRDVELLFVCDAHTVPWAADQIAARGIDVHPAVWTPAEHVELFGRLGLDAVVFDSYDLDASVYAAVRALPTLAIVDGDFRGAEADVLVDQNLAAEHDHPTLPRDSVRLAGLPYVMIRDEVLDHRPAEPPTARETAVPKVFAFFGGTDAFGAGPYVARALAATGLPFEATVVAPSPELAARIAAVELQPHQRLQTIGPTNQLAARVREADLTISASGTSTWELLCLGATTGLVCVVDNQVMGYERAVGTGAAAGLGLLSALETDASSAVTTLKRLLTDPAERGRLASAGWALVDGRGRERVADALLRLT
ncbi:spore coat polysaccharide biosynthesis predicted glycosyltransferase SpsG [Kribbella pratensis]|uniref:Spore coat polysaccharide biosynthesis predicted glycosyltransferase SpsG n=1 Tax=Kribbella pratensis TaxID=2512112 RepID=A0A4R8C4W4_9ACTN|nr:spore coat polysaccharide biosynthesis predicted glycosyltransferase SpsG [Kribbella pratensis]